MTADADLDPRIERSQRVVHAAVLEELGEVGYGAMTVESIARRAGVGKATIYRHWSGKLDLVESALADMDASLGTPVAAATDSPRARLTALIRGLAMKMSDSTLSACLPAIVAAAQNDDAVREFQLRLGAGKMAELVAVIEEAVEQGEVAAGLDPALAAEALVGPIFYRRLMTADPFLVEDVDRLVELVLG